MHVLPRFRFNVGSGEAEIQDEFGESGTECNAVWVMEEPFPGGAGGQHRLQGAHLHADDLETTIRLFRVLCSFHSGDAGFGHFRGMGELIRVTEHDRRFQAFQ